MTTFAELARRISAWTTRLLLSAIVVLAGWGFGRQITEWWSVDPAGVPSGGPARGIADEISAGEPPLVLSDQHWVMTWQGAAPSRDEALARLRARCQSLVADAPFPAEPPGPAEQRLLALLAESVPVAEEPGRWGLYQKDGPLALVVGTRSLAIPDGTAPTAGPLHRRVVVWGLAIPHGEQGWALYTFHPEPPPDAPPR